VGDAQQRFHEQWDRYIGPEAADLRYQGYVIRKRAFFVAVVILVFAISAGSTGPGSFAHDLLVGLAISTFVLQVLLMFIWFRQRTSQYKAASLHLGITVTAHNFPPGNEVGFSNWCKRNGICSAGGS